MEVVSKNKFSQNIWFIYCIPFLLMAVSLIFFCVIGFSNFSTSGNDNAITYFQGFYKIDLTRAAGVSIKSFTLNANGWIAFVLILLTLGTSIYAYVYKYNNHVNTNGSITSTIALFICLFLVLLIYIFFVSAAPNGKWNGSLTDGTFLDGNWSWITKFVKPSPATDTGVSLSKGGTFVEVWSIISGVVILGLTSLSLFKTYK